MQIILSHVGTDFDGLASMVLAQRIYPEAKLVFPGRLSTGVEEFYHLHRRFFPATPIKDALNAKIERIIVVDTRIASRLGAFRDLLHDPNIELYIYDHHPPTAEAVKGDQEWVEPVGAAATLLVERCQELDLSLTVEEASLALIAIHEETGSFRFSSTTSKDLTAASFLLRQGANLEVVNHYLRDPLSPAQRDLFEEFLSTGERVDGASGRLFLGAAKRQESIFGLGLLAGRILELEGMDAICLCLQVEKRGVDLAARSSTDELDVAQWMGHWGGGGHARAAAASRVQSSLAEIGSHIREVFQAKVVDMQTAADLMTPDVFSVDKECTISEAMEQLVAKGYQAACLVDEEQEILGIVSRTDLSRALEHDLGHAPARSVMTHKVVSVRPEDSIDLVRQTVVERDVGTLPVIKDGILVGIVSRTDLLREFYLREQQRNWSRPGLRKVVDLSDCPQPYKSWLEVTSQLAEARRQRVFAVGGFVRDTLLGRENDDVDLMVEGDALELASDVAKTMGGKLITHPKYMTAAIKFADGEKLDIASARKEVYVRSAALPEVAQSSLKSDLYRRDFTINSLALRIDSHLQAKVIDFFGGQQDLKNRHIRVLHNHSFFDDPTRILRAVRFEQRLGFKIEPHTQSLMKEALKQKVFAQAKPTRLAEELRLCLSEADPARVLERLEKLGVLKALHPDLRLKGKLGDRVTLGLEFAKAYPDLLDKEDSWLIPVLVIGSSLKEKSASELRAKFGWEQIEWPYDVHQVLGRISRPELRPSQVADYLDPLSGKLLIVFSTLSSHEVMRQRLRTYVEEHRSMKCPLNGHEIINSGVKPGPEISLWQKRLLGALRDEEISDKASAQTWLSQQLQTQV